MYEGDLCCQKIKKRYFHLKKMSTMYNIGIDSFKNELFPIMAKYIL